MKLKELNRDLALESETSNDGYRFEVKQAMQCREYFWVGTFRASELAPLFEAFFDRDESQPLELTQRSLDDKRAKTISEKYILKNLTDPSGFFVVPPLMVTAEIPLDAYYDFVPLKKGGSLGDLLLPPEAVFWIPDGQHRAFAYILSALNAPAAMQDEEIAFMMLQDCGGKNRQRIFLDINKHGVKPSKSILVLFDHNDPIAEIARNVLVQVEVFKGRTELERTNIRANSGDYFTLNSLKEGSGLLVSGYEGDRNALALAYWQAVASHHPDWKTPSLVTRDSSISYNALTVNALGLVGRRLFEESGLPGFYSLMKLHQIDWTKTNPVCSELFMKNGRIVKNPQTIEALADYIYNIIAAH